MVVVDDEEFALTVSGTTFHLTWLTGPNPGYGFTSRLGGSGTEEERAAMLAEMLTDDEIAARARSFLAEIDPATGYLAD